jgi:hypothetical protein
MTTENDPVNHPAHYTKHPSGIECIQITEHMNFCLGSAMKYIWRAGLKGDARQDLEKAKWYLDRELGRISENRFEEYLDSEIEDELEKRLLKLDKRLKKLRG